MTTPVEPTNVNVTYEAIQAAMAQIEQINKDVKARLWSRVFRTLSQGVVATAVLAAVGGAYDAAGHGVFSWSTLVFSAGQAAITAVVAYAHNKAFPSPTP